MDRYLIIITLIGLASLGMAWMPSISEKIKVSYSIIYMLIGMILYSLFSRVLPLPDPISKNDFTVHLTELVVIISLMGTGLKIDQPFSFRKWRVPLRLVSITMVLSIAVITWIAWSLFHFDLASALLLGAVLAPTDPVLAADVQVGPPHEGAEENVKFSLTAEAGFNDGTAFPFTWLAITLALIANTGQGDLVHWFYMDVLYRVFAGVAAGILLGKALAFVIFNLPGKFKFIEVNEGFVALSATLFIYGITELIHGYGFIAVFIAAITFRNSERDHKLHRKLHAFTDQVERILLAIVLILFGGSLVTGLLENLSWKTALFGIAFVFLIRPLTGLIGLLGVKLHLKEKMAIGFFGIKGIGSFFYLAFAFKRTDFIFKEEIWSMVAFIVMISIVIHGLTANSVMKKIDEQFSEEDLLK